MMPLAVASETPCQSAERPTIDVFAPYWSSHSSTQMPAIEALRADYEVVIHFDDTQYPQWVRDRASQHEGGGYPLLWWQIDDDSAKAYQWTSAADFCRAYEATTAPAPVLSQRQGGYPVHRQRFNIEGDWNPTLEKLVQHLLTNSNHQGKWDATWLAQLNRAELLSLHDDDHEGRVRGEYVRRPTVRVQAVVKPAAAVARCPGGVCPTQYATSKRARRSSRGLLSGLFQ